VQDNGGASYVSERIVGMWVPAEAFRQGTVIRLTGSSETSSARINIHVGGDTSDLGVTLFDATASANSSYLQTELVQRIDGHIVTNVGGYSFVGVLSIGGAVSVTTTFLQPLVFVQAVTVGTFTLTNFILEVIPRTNTYRRHQEILRA
jgi:hypothetical protein